MASKVNADRIAPLSGAAFVVFGVLGVFMVNAGTSYPGTPQELAQHYADGRGLIGVGAWFGMLSAAALAWFSGVLWRGLRASEGPGGRLSVAAFGGGVATAGILLISYALPGAAVLRSGEPSGISPEAATTIFDVSGVLWGGAAPAALAVLVAAVGLVALRHQAFPLWWGWGSLGLAALLLAFPIAWLAFIVAHAWVAVVALWMVAQEGGGVPGSGASAED